VTLDPILPAAVRRPLLFKEGLGVVILLQRATLHQMREICTGSCKAIDAGPELVEGRHKDGDDFVILSGAKNLCFRQDNRINRPVASLARGPGLAQLFETGNGRFYGIAHGVPGNFDAPLEVFPGISARFFEFMEFFL
jgi:hypothetical protein